MQNRVLSIGGYGDEQTAFEYYQKIIMVRTTIMLMPTARRPTTMASSVSNF